MKKLFRIAESTSIRVAAGPPRRLGRRYAVGAAIATLVAGCTTHVPPAAVAWNAATPIVLPGSGTSSAADVGYLVVETDTDLKEIGRQTYYNVRRSYDVYSADGRLIRASVDNAGARSGEEPQFVALPPGRYVIASVVGTTYRKVQVEVRPGARTDVPESMLREAPPVFER